MSVFLALPKIFHGECLCPETPLKQCMSGATRFQTIVQRLVLGTRILQPPPQPPSLRRRGEKGGGYSPLLEAGSWKLEAKRFSSASGLPTFMSSAKTL